MKSLLALSILFKFAHSTEQDKIPPSVVSAPAENCTTITAKYNEFIVNKKEVTQFLKLSVKESLSSYLLTATNTDWIQDVLDIDTGKKWEEWTETDGNNHLIELESCVSDCTKADMVLDMKPDMFGMSYEEQLEDGLKPHRMCRDCLKYLPEEKLNFAKQSIEKSLDACDLNLKERVSAPEVTESTVIQEVETEAPVPEEGELTCGLTCSFDSGDQSYASAGCKNNRVKRSSYYGIDSKQGIYPWHVAIRTKPDDALICSGVLINKNLVLTSAFCLIKKQKPVNSKKAETSKTSKTSKTSEMDTDSVEDSKTAIKRKSEENPTKTFEIDSVETKPVAAHADSKLVKSKKSKTHKTMNPKNMVLIFGMLDPKLTANKITRENKRLGAQFILAKKFIVHHNFNKNSKDRNDVALVVLKTPVAYPNLAQHGTIVRPACLPRKSLTQHVVDTAKTKFPKFCFISGYSTKLGTAVLRNDYGAVINAEQCQKKVNNAWNKIYKKTDRTVNKKREICLERIEADPKFRQLDTKISDMGSGLMCDAGDGYFTPRNAVERGFKKIFKTLLFF